MTARAMLNAIILHSGDEGLALQASKLITHTDSAVASGVWGLVRRALQRPEDYAPEVVQAFRAYDEKRDREQESSKAATVHIRGKKNDVGYWKMLAERHTGGNLSELVRRAIEAVGERGGF